MRNGRSNSSRARIARRPIRAPGSLRVEREERRSSAAARRCAARRGTARRTPPAPRARPARRSRRRRSRLRLAARAPAGCGAGSRRATPPGSTRESPTPWTAQVEPVGQRRGRRCAGSCWPATTRANRPGSSARTPKPIGPPQSWATRVMSALVQLRDQAARPRDVAGERVVGTGRRLVGAAEPDVVRRDRAEPGVGQDAGSPSRANAYVGWSVPQQDPHRRPARRRGAARCR